MLVLTLFLLFLGLNSQNVSIFDPRVYNYYFYVTTNSDVILSNITTESKARDHWSQIGIYEGMQACGSFHVKQFLDNYPSLKQKYGNNYTAAIIYYLQPNGGYDKNMLGYTIGGGYGRYTLGNVSLGLYISGSLRMGGAIDSLVYNNTEFINNWGHGRQLQLTVHNGSGACYSPTEAGQHIDEMYNRTKSIIRFINTTVNTLKSSVLSAYWMYPGQYDSRCGYAINTQNVSNYTMNKQIRLGYYMNGVRIVNNISNNVITYENEFYIPENQFNITITFESPTAYLTKPFDSFYSYNPVSNTLISYNISSNGGHNNTGNAYNFPIISTSNKQYALGVVPKELDNIRDYALYNFEMNTPDSNACTKWSVVQKAYNISKNTWLNYTNYLCIGKLETIINCINKIYKNIQN